MIDIRVVAIVIAGLMLCTPVFANVTDDRIYFEETTSIPFETWVMLFGAGLIFLILSAMTGFGGSGGLTMVFGIISFGFLASSAFATPVTGFYAYVANTSANATVQTTPIVWGAFQPWMMWLCWGLATIAFLLFVMGILILFKDLREVAHEEDQMDWI